jgi:hypothetical protein
MIFYFLNIVNQADHSWRQRILSQKRNPVTGHPKGWPFLQGEKTARDEWAVFRMDEKKARNKFSEG